MNYESKITELLARKKAIADDVASLLGTLTDKEIPLDDRWKTFTVLSKADLLPTASYGSGFIEECFGSKFCIYDDFYVERYQTVKYVDLYDTMTSREVEVTERLTEEMRDKWRERVLVSGFGSFTHDW
jgi:hypothetical protein